MKPFYPLYLLLVVSLSLFISSCGGGSNQANHSVASGVAQKGDFLKDSQISYAKYSKQGASSTDRLDGLIANDKGEFNAILPWTGWTKISVSGLFYNEYSGEKSTVSLTLNEISKAGESVDNLNIFTHLVAARIEYLVNQGKTVDNANSQALSDLKALFGLSGISLNRLNLNTNNHPDNAILLLFSAGFLANSQNQDLATALDKLTTDFADNGLLDGVAVPIYRRIANFAGAKDVFRPLQNNLVARGYSNPPQTNILPEWVNRNPLVSIEDSINGKIITVGETIKLQGHASDPDGQIKSYLWTEGAVSKGAGDSIVLVNLSVGEHFFKLTVTDNLGAKNSASIKITVNSSTNKAPIVNAGLDKTINFGESITLNGTAKDLDGSIAAWKWVKNGITRKSGSGGTIAPLRINNLSIGLHVFQLEVTDNKGAVSTDSVIVSVNAKINRNPVVSAGADKIIKPGESVTLNGTVSDPDGDAIVSWKWKLNGVVKRSGSGSNIPPYVVSGLGSGQHIFYLEATDNKGAVGSDSVKVTVNAAVNKKPVVNAGADKIIKPGESVTLNGTVSDPDGDAIVSWKWKLGGVVKKSGSGSNIPPYVISGLGSGQHIFYLEATDNKGAIGSDSVKVIVNAAVNKKPVVNAGADKIIKPGESVTLNGTVSDPDGDTIVSWKWKLGGVVKKSGSGSNIPPYTISGLSAGSHTFTLEATDNKGATGSDQVTVTVNNNSANKPPVANAGSDKTIVELQAYVLTGSGTDSDGSISSYKWKEGANTLSNTKTLNLKGLSPGTHHLTLEVTDNDGAKGSDSMTVTVNSLKVNLQNQAICRTKYGYNIQVIYSLSGNRTGGGNSVVKLYSNPGCSGTVTYNNSDTASYVINSVSASGSTGTMTITSQGKSSPRPITIDSSGNVTSIN